MATFPDLLYVAIQSLNILGRSVESVGRGSEEPKVPDKAHLHLLGGDVRRLLLAERRVVPERTLNDPGWRQRLGWQCWHRLRLRGRSCLGRSEGLCCQDLSS